MFKRAVESYRAINRPGPPEHSRSFRAAVAVTVLISVVAATRTGAVGPVTSSLVVVGVVVGSYYSYLTRAKPNLALKAVLSVLLLVVFVMFWVNLVGYIQDLRYPLVNLFLWLQVMHSFNLPMRRDLDFSLASAAILIAFAGSLSLSTGFIYTLAAFFIAGFISLYLGRRSELASKADVFIEGAGRRPWRPLAAVVLMFVPLTLVFFILIPRLPGFSGYYLPMSNWRPMKGDFLGLVRNPGYPDMPESFPEDPLPFRPGAYPGFSRFLDLRVRGVPDDVVVMKVRSPRPAYWRATAFDRYLGNGWENTEKDLEVISSEGLPLLMRYGEEQPRIAVRDLVHTFYIEEELPNTVFAAYQARDVFFPTEIVKVDSMSTVLVPLELSPGLIYTVVSEESTATPEMLRTAVGPRPDEIYGRYCRLPPMSPEVARISREVTAKETNDFDRVAALSDYLKGGYEYDLRCPPQGKDENTVEFFLFRQKRGYCEHFATALAAMCRSLGIPSRVAVGYSTGDMNPFTGYYEVSARDAHAWVEVYFPGYGWHPFDPTPGWPEPYMRAGKEELWSGFAVFNYIGRALSSVFPASLGRALKGAAKSAWDAVATAGRSVLATVRDYWPAVLIALGLLALAALLLWWRRRAGVPGSPSGEPPPGPRSRAVLLFERLTALLADAGFPRRPSQTPREYGAEVAVAGGPPLVEGAVDLFTKARFAREEPGPEELSALHRAVDLIERELEAGEIPATKH